VTRAIFTSEQLRLFSIVGKVAKQQGISAYIVGGTVRDLFLDTGEKNRDVDFVLEGDSEAFAVAVAESIKGEVRLFPSFLTAKLIKLEVFSELTEVDFASARQETYSSPGSLPEVRISDIRRDLRRRDFSINAMAINLEKLGAWVDEGSLRREALQEVTLDLFDGLKDLSRGFIRVLHERSFKDDPTRLFRACRYATRVDGCLEPETEALAKSALQSGVLEDIDAYRKFKELKKVFYEEKFFSVFKNMLELELFKHYPVFSLSRSGELSIALAKLEGLKICKSKELVFRTALRLFSKFSSEPEEMLRQLGLSTKKVSEILEDLATIDRDMQSDNISDEALLCGFALNKESGVDFREIALDRGLIL